MKFIINIFQLLIRYSLSINNLGILNTVKILYLRIFKKNASSLISSSKFGKIYWRSKLDYGVIGHLFSRQVSLNTFGDTPKIIFDMGANIGIETLRFCKLFPNSKIIAVEPQKENFDILKMNTREKENVTIINKALWNKIDKVSIYNYSDRNSQTFITEKNNERFDNISTTTINNLIKEYEIDKIDILKIDIEGSEQRIFDKSADEWLKKVNVLIIECPDNDKIYSSINIYESFLRNNLKFKTYINGENFVFVKEGCEWIPENISLY